MGLGTALHTTLNGVQALTGWRRALLAFLCGIAAALSMAPVYALPLLAIAMPVLVLLIDASATHVRPLRSAFWAGWMFGFGFFLAGIYWMAFSFFVQAEEFAWMAPFAVTGLPAFLAVFTGGAAALARRFWPDGWRRIIWFAVVFVGFEYLRGHILTGLPWNLTGQALAGSAITAQSAAIYGAYGLSFVTMLLACAPVSFIDQQTNWRGFAKGAGITAAGVLALLGFGALRLVEFTPPTPKAYVRIVQPSISQRDKINPDFWGRNFNANLELSEASGPGDIPLYVVWPENAAPLLNETPSALQALEQALPPKAILIAGAVRREAVGVDGIRFFNAIQIFDRPQRPASAQTDRLRREIIAFYDKHHLVPFGEYLPFFGVLDAVGLSQLTPYGDGGFSAGKGPQVFDIGPSRFAPFICYEAIFPGAIYPKGERPDWLVTVTNDAWFGDSSGPRQHLDQARLRAIETGLPLARAANTGISALIDGNGRILHRLALYENGVIDAPLPAPLAPTLYDRFGDAIFGLMLLAGALIAQWTRPRHG